MTGADRLVTARDVRRCWLGAIVDTSSDCLALLALDAIEQRDSYRAALYAAVDDLHDRHVEIQRLRERVHELILELRQLRAPQREAA